MAPPDESPPRSRGALPARIGRYRIVDRVGRGAMGVVYAAHDDAMGRPVAVKVLMGDLESDPDTRTRFYREAQAAAGLLHPNIITIFDAGEDQGRSYIAMQLLEGAPLSAYLKQPEAAPLERKLDLMVQMCEGLAAAHGRGIVHRDLKPGNLFVQSDGLLKILDFGVARLADSSMTATGMMLGTPDYMSPEQARGTQVDARSDIFSAGAVFYFMLAGRKPFPGPDLPAVLRQLQSEEPIALRESDAPPELTRLVMQAMAKDPADRPPRVQDLLAGIVRFRRHYLAATRKLAADAAARYNAVVAADAALRKASEALEVTSESGSGVIASMKERFPALADRGAAALETLAFERNRVEQLVAELDAEQQRLEGEAGRRGNHVRVLDEAEQLLRAGNGRAALPQLQQVRAEYPSSRRASALTDEAARVARQQDETDRRLQEMLASAREAFEARDWAKTIDATQRVLTMVPDHPAAASMLAEAQQAVAREARRRALLLQQALDRAAVAIEEARFADAEEALSEAERLDPQSSSAADLRLELADARAAAAEAERIERLSVEEIHHARATFRRGQYDDAIARMRGFVAAHPGAARAVAEAETLVALRERILNGARARRERVEPLLDAAAAFADRGAWGEALATAREAVRCDPSDVDATAALDAMMTKDLEARLERERQRAHEQRFEQTDTMLAAAREAHVRGFLPAALDAARAALRIAPDRTDVAAYVDELRRVIDTDDGGALDLADDPFSPPASEDTGTVRVQLQPDASGRPPEGGVFSHVNQWAADLLRRRSNR